jgi:hypothetical protein
MGRAIFFAFVLFFPALASAVCGPWPFPDYVSLRVNNGSLLGVERGGGRDVVANASTVGRREKFKIATIDGTPLAWGKRITLKGWGGQFVVAEPGAILRNNRNEAGEWESFTLVYAGRVSPSDCSQVKVRLKTSRGTFVSAIGGGGGQLDANSTNQGRFETFVMRRQPGALVLGPNVLKKSNTPDDGGTRWRRLRQGDHCGISFAEDDTGVVLNIDCGSSPFVGARVEAEVFRGMELENGWHLTSFEVNRGVNGLTDGIDVRERPAELPTGDVRLYVKFNAECPARTSCGFTVMNSVQGPRGEPMF